jgi:mRNA-degrading endonuclease RelE of RelBE toxin-antitoxin system
LKIRYSDRAVKDLKGFNAVDRTLIATKTHYLADNFAQLTQSKKIRELKGTKYTGQYRYTIARKIRAIFRIEDDAIVMLILRLGLRKNIY